MSYKFVRETLFSLDKLAQTSCLAPPRAVVCLRSLPPWPNIGERDGSRRNRSTRMNDAQHEGSGRGRPRLPEWLDSRTAALIGTILTVGIAIAALIIATTAATRTEIRNLRSDLSGEIHGVRTELIARIETSARNCWRRSRRLRCVCGSWSWSWWRSERNWEWPVPRTRPKRTGILRTPPRTAPHCRRPASGSRLQRLREREAFSIAPEGAPTRRSARPPVSSARPPDALGNRRRRGCPR